MRRSIVVSMLLAMAAQSALAQPVGSEPLNEEQQLGRRLFAQSCGVCHAKPTITSGLYGPPLSKGSLGGQEDVMVQVISNGTPRMPGFKYHFEPAQIEAIVAYLRTIPPPPAAAAPVR
jgi:mono/diheme cytochrome c family protein